MPSAERPQDSGVKIAKRFTLGEKIGEGSFGEVYLGHDLLNRKRVAIKMSDESKSKNLQQEARMYGRLNSDEERTYGVPHLLWAGSQAGYYFLVMDKLGPSLSDLVANSDEGHFSLKTICMLAIQGLYLLEYVHSFDLIHRDMKPNNFLMGEGKFHNHLYLIDFGLAKPYRDQKTGEHIEYLAHKNLTGTARYVSINTHLGIEQSRRDDLESFGYVLIHLATGRLPWQGIRHEDKKERYRLIGEKKQSVSVDKVCQGLPKEFVDYLEYCQDLGFTEEPNYHYLRSLFIQIAKRGRFRIDGIYDWNRGNLGSP
jgi:serine/threonine protein kinase